MRLQPRMQTWWLWGQPPGHSCAWAGPLLWPLASGAASLLMGLANSEDKGSHHWAAKRTNSSFTKTSQKLPEIFRCWDLSSR